MQCVGVPAHDTVALVFEGLVGDFLELFGKEGGGSKGVFGCVGSKKAPWVEAPFALSVGDGYEGSNFL